MWAGGDPYGDRHVYSDEHADIDADKYCDAHAYTDKYADGNAD